MKNGKKEIIIKNAACAEKVGTRSSEIFREAIRIVWIKDMRFIGTPIFHLL
ncbi:hypothetical protein [Anaerosporobacter faecicola]|uniref:hypothetical protein n=1 Tax=Anaerosporobacter faecicola TaxID=2718714 RepID=UPI001EE546FB|nr:hypothetical protein [Anaerosporobacter faecicola]